MSDKAPRRLLIAAGSIVVLAAAVVGGTYLYVNVFSGDARAPLSLSTSPPTDDAGDSSPGDSSAADNEMDLDGTWVVSDSEAGYRVGEVLNGQTNTVVGRTDEVSGEITVDDGVATAGEVVIDMTTVVTDSDARDSQFRGTIMQTDEFPEATFTLTEPVVLDNVNSSGPTRFDVSGELTLRDVSRSVEAAVDVRRTGATVEVAGTIDLTLADFEIDPPNLGFVRVEDTGVVEFLLTLAQ